MTSTNIPFPCADYSFVGLPKTLSKILTKILTIFPNPFTFQQFMMFCWILFTFSTSIMVYFLTRAFETLILLFTLFPSLIIFRKIFLLHFSSKQSNKIPKWNLKFYQESLWIKLIAYRISSIKRRSALNFHDFRCGAY